MEFTSQDVTIIERALRAAMKYEQEENRTRDYREVLMKLQESANQALSSHQGVTLLENDGIRYDYDDSSDLI